MRILNTRNTRYIDLANNVATYLGIQTEAIDIAFEMESETASDYGYCDGNVEYADISVYRKIYGEKVEDEEICRTIIHELVHAKQFLEGRLIIESGVYSWLGKEYSNNLKESPWELEAIALEVELQEMYK